MYHIGQNNPKQGLISGLPPQDINQLNPQHLGGNISAIPDTAKYDFNDKLIISIKK